MSMRGERNEVSFRTQILEKSKSENWGVALPKRNKRRTRKRGRLRKRKKVRKRQGTTKKTKKAMCRTETAGFTREGRTQGRGKKMLYRK